MKRKSNTPKSKNIVRCEYCGKRYNSYVGAAECRTLRVCRGMNFPKAEVIMNFRVRACAVVLAKTAGMMFMRSPAAASCVRSQKLGQCIVDWSDRVYRALEANTPMSLGRASRIQAGLLKHVEHTLWTDKDKLPNLFLLELALMYADAAKEFVIMKIENKEHRNFWFEEDHPEWLLFDAVSMPLAMYMAKMKERKQTSKLLNSAIVTFGEQFLRINKNPIVGNRKKEAERILPEMLDHCWRDELKSWRFLEGAMERAAKHIREHGTEASNDLTNFDTVKTFNILYDYIWQDDYKANVDGVAEKPKLKIWLVGNRFWVASASRKEAETILTRDTGLVLHGVSGVDQRKKLYDQHNKEAGTVGDLLVGLDGPQLIGVAQ